MQTDQKKPVAGGFASRLHELCSEKGLPARGRQSELARLLGVTQGATRKWLTGVGFPDMDKIIQICEWAGANVNWLVMGIGPKRSDVIDTKTVILGEAIDSMRPEDRQQVLDFIGYKIERSGQFYAGEQLARYMKMIDAFKRDRDRMK